MTEISLSATSYMPARCSLSAAHARFASRCVIAGTWGSQEMGDDDDGSGEPRQRAWEKCNSQGEVLWVRALCEGAP